MLGEALAFGERGGLSLGLAKLFFLDAGVADRGSVPNVAPFGRLTGTIRASADSADGRASVTSSATPIRLS